MKGRISTFYYYDMPKYTYWKFYVIYALIYIEAIGNRGPNHFDHV